MSQKAQILNYMRRGRTITPLEALKMFHCFRLGARIYELRAAGYPIMTTTVENSYRQRFAKYWMKK